MGCRTDRLLTLAGAAFSGHPPLPGRFDGWGSAGQALAALLAGRNGFSVYLNALTIYSADSATGPLSIDHLNNGDWRRMSCAIQRQDLVFASDLFGGLIAIRDGAIWRFDPETDSMQRQAETLGQWQEMVADDPDGMVSYGDALAWRIAGHLLPAGHGLSGMADGGFEECQMRTLVSRLLARREPGALLQATGFA